MNQLESTVDPLDFAKVLWPHIVFYKEQVEIIRSVQHNNETVVVAGNQLGKDFVSGFIALWFFLCHRVCRIVCTSVKDDHLRVLFGEIERFIQESKYPLLAKRKRDKMLGYTATSGGPLWVNFRDIRKYVDGKQCPISYLRGAVSERGEGLQGHHAANTLAILDEASAVQDSAYNAMATWAKRILIIGNPLPPIGGANFFYNFVKQGDIYVPDGTNGVVETNGQT